MNMLAVLDCPKRGDIRAWCVADRCQTSLLPEALSLSLSVSVREVNKVHSKHIFPHTTTVLDNYRAVFLRVVIMVDSLVYSYTIYGTIYE